MKIVPPLHFLLTVASSAPSLLYQRIRRAASQVFSLLSSLFSRIFRPLPKWRIGGPSPLPFAATRTAPNGSNCLFCSTEKNLDVILESLELLELIMENCTAKHETFWRIEHQKAALGALKQIQLGPLCTLQRKLGCCLAEESDPLSKERITSLRQRLNTYIQRARLFSKLEDSANKLQLFEEVDLSSFSREQAIFLMMFSPLFFPSLKEFRIQLSTFKAALRYLKGELKTPPPPSYTSVEKCKELFAHITRVYSHLLRHYPTFLQRFGADDTIKDYLKWKKTWEEFLRFSGPASSFSYAG